MVSNIEQNNTVTLGVVKTPQLLHIPVLYEESTAVIDWQSIAGAAGYELEQSLDGEAFVLVYSGIGTETPAPDQSLTWSDINTMGKTWNEWETAGDNGDGLSWHEFSLLWPMGLDWNQLESMNKAWSELEDEDLTWRELEQLPPRGLTWNSMNATWLSWNDWNELGDNEDGLTWREFENLPPDNITRIAAAVTIPLYSKYSAYRVRAFDAQGNYSEYKATGIIYHLPRSLAKYRPNCLHIPELYREQTAQIIWSELYGTSKYVIERSMDGSAFSVVYDGNGTPVPPPFGGLNWEEIEGENQTWAQLEAWEKSWFELESLSTPGLIWGNANAYQLTWSEFEEKELTWSQLESLQVHTERHFSFVDTISRYVKTLTYRIRAYNTTDFSQYLISNNIVVNPRSLKNDEPPCLHIPELHENANARIVWGELYDASGYIIERKFETEQSFSVIYNGAGNPVASPCHLPETDKHFEYVDFIPIGKTQVTYQIQAYNTTDSSKWLTGKSEPIIPVFYRTDSISFAVINGNEYAVQIQAEGIPYFANIVITAEFNPAQLSLLLSQDEAIYGIGAEEGSVFRELSNQAGKLQFRCERNISDTKEWAGFVTRLKFKALTTGTATIKLY